MRCPACSKWINWLQKWRFAKGFCLRKASECPHCGVTLIWAKWPHRLAISGVFSMILGGLSGYFFPDKTAFGLDLGRLFAILGIALMILGLIRLRFVLAYEDTR